MSRAGGRFGNDFRPIIVVVIISLSQRVNQTTSDKTSKGSVSPWTVPGERLTGTRLVSLWDPEPKEGSFLFITLNIRGRPNQYWTKGVGSYYGPDVIRGFIHFSVVLCVYINS